jgi:hypothetical protein
LLNDSVVGTDVHAALAFTAQLGVDNILAIPLADGLVGAFVDAASAFDAVIGDYDHNKNLLVLWIHSPTAAGLLYPDLPQRQLGRIPVQITPLLRSRRFAFFTDTAYNIAARERRRSDKQKIQSVDPDRGEDSARALPFFETGKADEEEVPRRAAGPTSVTKVTGRKIERSADASRAQATARTFPS